MQAEQAPTLRPLGVGDVLDRTFNLYRAKPLVFIGLAAIWYLILVLIFVALAVLVFASVLAGFAEQVTRATGPQLTPEVVIGLVVFFFVAVIAAILLLSGQSASLVHAGAQSYLGKDATIGEAFRAGLRAAGRLFLAGLLVVLAVALVWIVPLVIAALANQAILFVIAVCAALVGTFYLGASWLVAPVIVVVENAGPVAALSRSWRLSGGNRWRIIGIQVLLLILNLILSVLIGAIFAIGGQSDQPTIGNVIQTLANLASTIVWAPVQWLAFTVLYYDLRVRKEAFDLQLAAEALPQS